MLKRWRGSPFKTLPFPPASRKLQPILEVYVTRPSNVQHSLSLLEPPFPSFSTAQTPLIPSSAPFRLESSAWLPRSSSYSQMLTRLSSSTSPRDGIWCVAKPSSRLVAALSLTSRSPTPQPELAHPHHVLAPKAEIVTASPKGGIAPLDPNSVEMSKSDKSSIDFLNNHQHVWEKTKPLSEFIGRASEFDALFYPGGHGPMYDLVDDKDSIKLIEEFYKAGKPVAAVCHGPIVFLHAKIDGKPLVQGRRLTGFTNQEEDQVQLSEAMPLLLEDELKKAGAEFVSASQPWGEMVVVDGQIITGQNPASAKGVGEAIAKAIGTTTSFSET